MPFLSSVQDQLRQGFALARVRPAMEAGLRCAVAMTVPIAIGEMVGQLGPGTLLAVGAWFSLLADVGGTYPQKARAMLGATALIGCSVALAGASVFHPVLSLVFLFCWIFGAGFAPLFGATPGQISFLSSLTFLVALSFSRPETALLQALLYVLGGLWGTMLSLLVWSIHPNRPIREATNQLYVKIAELLRPENLRRQPGDVNADSGTASALREFTTDLTNARTLWETLRSRRYGLSQAERFLLVSVTNAQQTVRSVLSYLAIASALLADRPELEPLLMRLTDEFASASRAIGLAILNRQTAVDLQGLQSALEAFEAELEHRRTEHYAASDQYRILLNFGKCVRQAYVVTGQLKRIAELLGHPERIGVDEAGHPITVRRTVAPDLVRVVRANLTLDSVTCRHAFRLALVTVLAQMLGHALPGGRGYWVPISALVILRPDYGGTFSRTVQRVGGTMIGGLIGAVLGVGVQTTAWQTVLIAFLAFCAFTVRPLNYAIFTLALTPLFMMIVNLVDKGDWEVSLMRIADTWLGAGIALIGAWIVLPSWQRTQLPAFVAQLLRSNARYFRHVIDYYLGGIGEPEEIDRLHLGSELASSNAEAALQRLQSDPARVRHQSEEWTTLILYARSLTNSISSLAEHAREFKRPDPPAEIFAVGRAITASLESLATALETKKPPEIDIDLQEGPGALRSLVDQLHAARLEERSRGFRPEVVTPTLQAVRENTFLSLEIDQIVNKISVLRDTVGRLLS